MICYYYQKIKKVSNIVLTNLTPTVLPGDYKLPKIMIFSKGKKDYSKYHFFQNNSQIEIVERYKYLGIVFYFNGNLKHAADYLYNKALKAFFSVKSKFNNFQEVPLKTCLKLFDSLLKPILTYGSEIWLSDYNINLNNFDNLPI